MQQSMDNWKPWVTYVPVAPPNDYIFIITIPVVINIQARLVPVYEGILPGIEILRPTSLNKLCYSAG